MRSTLLILSSWLILFPTAGLPQSQASTIEVEGFSLLLPQASSKDLECIKILSTQIRRAISVIPDRPEQLIRNARIRFIVEKDSPVSDRAAIWVPPVEIAEVKIKDHQKYSNSIVIPNCDRFAQWTSTQKSLVLHEMAHVYLVQLLVRKRFDEVESLEKAYLKAKTSGKYERVQHVSGNPVQAYAITSMQEYFAEGTEAFLADNDYYPFKRSELKQFDPDLYSILSKLWR